MKDRIFHAIMAHFQSVGIKAEYGLFQTPVFFANVDAAALATAIAAELERELAAATSDKTGYSLTTPPPAAAGATEPALKIGDRVRIIAPADCGLTGVIKSARPENDARVLYGIQTPGGRTLAYLESELVLVERDGEHAR